jgi:PKD repeat protein
MYLGATCQSTWCADVIVGNSIPCVNYFTFVNNGLSVNFTGHMVNAQPATFYWEFGDGLTGAGQTIVHQYPQPGIYFVTLTTTTQNPVMCTYTSSQSITVGDSTQWNQVYGQVFAGIFPMESGIVMIMSYDTSLNYNPFIDICNVDSMGIYIFPYVPLGEYVIYALPFTPTGYLPTYYGDVLFWEDATVIVLGQANNPYDIHLIEATGYLPGPGSVSGQIQTGLKSTLIDKITMILMNEQSQAISFHQVNADGEFVFPALDYGVYYLHAEIAGCQSDKIRVEITLENPDPTVVLTFNGNSILGVKEPAPSAQAGVVFPNPASETAQINVTLNDASVVFVELFNSAGQLVFRNTESFPAGTTAIRIPVGSLTLGVYHLRLYDKSGIITSQRLLKSR